MNGADNARLLGPWLADKFRRVALGWSARLNAERPWSPEQAQDRLKKARDVWTRQHAAARRSMAPPLLSALQRRLSEASAAVAYGEGPRAQVRLADQGLLLTDQRYFGVLP